MIGGEFVTFRIAGDDAIDFFLQTWRLDDALRLDPPFADPKGFWWFRRSLLAARARLHRALSAYQVRYKLEIDIVDKMIELGELYQLVHDHAGMPVTYSDVYLTKGNPYTLKYLLPHITIANADGSRSTFIFGVANLAGAQGGERFNAYHKITFPLLTNGHPGAEEKYLENLYVVRAAIASGDFSNSHAPPIVKHQRHRWPEEEETADADEEASAKVLAARRRERRKRDARVSSVGWSCACGRPAADLDFAALTLDVPRAACLRLEKGTIACATCHDIAKVIVELGVDEATGDCARIMKEIEYVRVKEAAQAKFDTRAEELRVTAQREEEQRAAAAAVTATDLLDSAETAGDATGDDPNAAADEADSSSSDEEGTPVRRHGMARV